jgi:predicted SAM-dependent methyltransferase
MYDTVEFNNFKYPRFQAEGNASQFAIPFAKHLCKGVGVDVGCNRYEWLFPGAIAVDPVIDSRFHALELGLSGLDYIYSSHCLEHLDSWVEAVEYWHKCLKEGGILFLYLPDYSQEYWRPWNNRKHKHIIDKEHIHDLMESLGFKDIMVSGTDLNNSYMIVGCKG